MDRPKLLNSRWRTSYYDTKEFNNFFDNLNITKEDITGKTLYLYSKNISQSKIRENGFKITRDKTKADVLIIEDFRKHNSFREYDYGVNNGGLQINIDSNCGLEAFLNDYASIEALNIKLVHEADLYKYLYKYEGNQELHKNIIDLLNSKNKDNQKIAMEFMSNANWANNEIYLHDIFSKYWNGYMRSHDYRTSISFRGFLSSLDFNYENVYINEANDYRNLCKNQEHHDWVYNKFKEEFKEQLDDLVTRHKIKINKLEYSIDFSLNNKEND